MKPKKNLKITSIKFQGNPSGGSRTDTRGQTGRQTRRR